MTKDLDRIRGERDSYKSRVHAMRENKDREGTDSQQSDANTRPQVVRHSSDEPGAYFLTVVIAHADPIFQ